MPSMDKILVKDDAATPVEITLNPISDNPQPFWRGNVDGVPLEGQVRLTLLADEQQKNGVKMSCKLEVPVMEAIGTAGASSGYIAPAKVAHVSTVIITMFTSKRATNQDRANALKMAIGIAQGAGATTGGGWLANTSAGSAFSDSVAPVVQFFTKLVRPS